MPRTNGSTSSVSGSRTATSSLPSRKPAPASPAVSVLLPLPEPPGQQDRAAVAGDDAGVEQQVPFAEHLDGDACNRPFEGRQQLGADLDPCAGAAVPLDVDHRRAVRLARHREDRHTLGLRDLGATIDGPGRWDGEQGAQRGDDVSRSDHACLELQDRDVEGGGCPVCHLALKTLSCRPARRPAAGGG